LNKLAPVEHADDLWPTPLLVVHSRGDQLIPVRLGASLHHAAGEPKRAVYVDDLDHNEVFQDVEVLAEVERFFSEAALWSVDEPPL
jgi:fermentation-respiration switch protein FrsA (DUF1100 family)